MGGDIQIFSESGKGTTVSFSVPCLGVNDEPPQYHPESLRLSGISHVVPSLATVTRPSEKLTILVVDDSEINRKVLKKILNSLGCEVETASEGKEV
jgi:hypothetical protein